MEAMAAFKALIATPTLRADHSRENGDERALHRNPAAVRAHPGHRVNGGEPGMMGRLARHAQLAASIPDAGMRMSFVKDATQPQYAGEPRRVRAAQELKSRDYMVDLRNATFDLDVTPWRWKLTRAAACRRRRLHEPPATGSAIPGRQGALCEHVPDSAPARSGRRKQAEAWQGDEKTDPAKSARR